MIVLLLLRFKEIDIHRHLILERDLQKESCSCSKIVPVNRSNKAWSSLLKEPKTVNPMGMSVTQLGLMTGRYFAFFVVMSAAKTLSKKMFELAAKEDTRVGSQPKVSMRSSLEQSSSATRMMPSARRPVTPGAVSLRHTRDTHARETQQTEEHGCDMRSCSCCKRMSIRFVTAFKTTFAYTKLAPNVNGNTDLLQRAVGGRNGMSAHLGDLDVGQHSHWRGHWPREGVVLEWAQPVAWGTT
jgi:hypothetical protein